MGLKIIITNDDGEVVGKFGSQGLKEFFKNDHVVLEEDEVAEELANDVASAIKMLYPLWR